MNIVRNISSLNIKGLSKIEESAIDEVRDTLVKKYHNILFMLKIFGSKARGDQDQFSDIDLLAVVKGDKWQLSEQMSGDVYQVIAKYDYGMVISLIVLDDEQYRLNQKIGTSFYENLMRDSIDLWKKETKKK